MSKSYGKLPAGALTKSKNKFDTNMIKDSIINQPSRAYKKLSAKFSGK